LTVPLLGGVNLYQMLFAALWFPQLGAGSVALMVASAELIVSVKGVTEMVVAVLQKSLATAGGVFVGVDVAVAVAVAVDVGVTVRVAVTVGVDVEVCAAAGPTTSATQTNPASE